MLDAPLRRRLSPPLQQAGGWLFRRGVTPNQVTAAGLVVGLGACVATAAGWWWLALLLWLANRAADGLDGPLARADPRGPTELGGFLDIMADFAIYGGMLVAIGWAVPEARLAALAVFSTYYLSGSAFLAWSSLAARRQLAGDGRSLHFPTGLAEGTETIAAYVVVLALPGRTATILWVWAAIVGVTVVQRLVFVTRSLSDPPCGPGGTETTND